MIVKLFTIFTHAWPHLEEVVLNISDHTWCQFQINLGAGVLQSWIYFDTDKFTNIH